MKHACPRCQTSKAWKLNDGRRKCPHCGHRYTAKSVWQSSRLSDRVKRHILRDFVQGVSSCRHPVSRRARARFLARTRMAMAVHEQYHEPFSGSHIPAGGSGFDNPMVIGIRQLQDRIRVFPVFGSDARRLVALLDQTSDRQGLFYTAEQYAFGAVSTRDDVVIAHPRQPYVPCRDTEIERFWHTMTHWLVHYHKIPVSCFHLFIGEVSFRFHHRNRSRDLFPSALSCVKKTTVQEIDGM